MKSISIYLYPILVITSLISGCKVLDKYQSIFPSKPLETKITEQETVYIYCEEGDIQDYVDKGWEIVNTEIEQVPCTWKTEKARPGCNLRDKGCKISVPDKIGEQIKYLLEKESVITSEEKK